ncbi:glycosyltransferase [Xylanibacter brevis]|uniref:glycosyltransferase n=1 Tax=Xylanibacter brevis TaxID=83231 RepID=UPI0006947975|nr:glycosyltransferase [Xylanibacter brevis]
MKNNILIILKRPPFPLSSGGDQAMFNGLEAISDVANVYLTYYDPAGYLDERRKGLENKLPQITVIPYKNKEKKNIFKRIVGKFLRIVGNKSVDDMVFKPLYTCESFPLGYHKHINRIVEDYNINIVQVEMIWLASLVTSLPGHVKKVFVHHELGFVRHQLELSSYGENLYRKCAVEVNKIIEIGLLNLYDAIITLSSIDSQKLRDNGVIKPIYDSFAVVQKADKTHSREYNAHKLVFVGPQSSSPNVLALEFFLDNCWLDLLKMDDEYNFNVIGNWSQEKITKITKSYRNVNFLGFVNKLSDAISDSIMIVPITVGSGIRMKILEAAQIGVPVVTTTVGVEGIPFRDKKECLISDTPQGFVNAILELKDNQLRETIVNNAKVGVEKNYSMDALKENRKSIYKQICK